MAVILKPKRSETSSASPTVNDLAVGEIAVNTADRVVYMKDSNNNIVTLSNYAESDPRLVFPTGDLGTLGSAGTDAFGQVLSGGFDNLDTPYGSLSTQDLGGLS